jgi:hypothetical protein
MRGIERLQLLRDDVHFPEAAPSNLPGRGQLAGLASDPMAGGADAIETITPPTTGRNHDALR